MILAKSFGVEFESLAREIVHPLPAAIEQHWSTFFPKVVSLNDGRDGETDKIVPTDLLYWEVICMDAIANDSGMNVKDMSAVFGATSEIYKHLEDVLGEFAVELLSQIAFERIKASDKINNRGAPNIVVTISDSFGAL
jgi:hypothetical protein